MYFWNCWITKRYRLAIYLTLAITLTVLATLPTGMVYRSGHLEFETMTPQQVVTTWNSGVENTLVLLLVLLLFAAADLGALALGDDSQRRDLGFLITRPRPRRYFVWTSWLAGLAQLFPLLALPVLTSIVVLFAITHAMLPGPLLPRSAALYAMAAAMYTLVFLLAILTGSAQNGFQFAALVIVIYNGYHYTLTQIFYAADYRSSPPVGAFDWVESPYQLFPFANLVILICLTLALPLIAQEGFRRRDL